MILGALEGVLLGGMQINARCNLVKLRIVVTLGLYVKPRASRAAWNRLGTGRAFHEIMGRTPRLLVGESTVSASNNTLSLVYRDPGTMRFVKYVGSKAPSSRWDISMEYQVPQDDDDEQDVKEAPAKRIDG